MTPPYPHIHVIINPASGPNRPILNTLNDVFRKHGVDWDVSITKRYGDATQQAKDAIARGVDLVVGYGGDGTQHELANAVIGTGMPMVEAILLKKYLNTNPFNYLLNGQHWLYHRFN